MKQAQVLNPGKVAVKGAEFDFDYKTPIEGLSFYGAVGYNDAKYDVFSVACYPGQTQAQECDFGAPTATVINGQMYLTYAIQDLAGAPLLRAPKWSGSIGVKYQGDIGSDLKLGLNADMSFSSSYFDDVNEPLASLQKSYTVFDASARLGAKDDSWEVALIGRNLTDRYYSCVPTKFRRRAQERGEQRTIRAGLVSWATRTQCPTAVERSCSALLYVMVNEPRASCAWQQFEGGSSFDRGTA